FKHFPSHAANQPIRKQPKVPATEETHILRAKLGDRNGEFDYFTSPIPHKMGNPQGLWHSTMPMKPREYRRIVIVTRGYQLVEKPRCRLGHRKASGTIPQHSCSRYVFQKQAGPQRIFTKLIW